MGHVHVLRWKLTCYVSSGVGLLLLTVRVVTGVGLVVPFNLN